ncbi:MAG: phosphoribosylformylglycinamidine synthase subunit PurL [Planctomycetota bacterium]
MLYQIEITMKKGLLDPLAEAIASDIKDLGITSVQSVKVVQIFLIESRFSTATAERLASELLSDPVINDFTVNKPVLDEVSGKPHIVQVVKKPGVMDTVEESLNKGIKDAGISAKRVKTARKYLFYGKITQEDAETVANKILANNVIEEIICNSQPLAIPPEPADYKLKITKIDLVSASNEELLRLSKEGQLSLSLEEMHAVRDYFVKLGRKPTDCELETIAQTWSEHCIHKTFRGKIDYNGKVIDNLLKNTIMRATKELNKPWCVSVFKDNAGVIEFDEKNNVCFKVETHNHPSAIEPYGGAGTGIGGVIRDPLGTGLGAFPVANTDVFCFGPPDYPHEKLPKGTLHPKRVMKGVISGVRDYGNRMGIPTINGAVLFDERYVGNPLVYCGTVGVLPKNRSYKKPKKGDLVILVGGRTGRDGIHGVTFASVELTDESERVSSGAVQIGNAIEEKKTLDTLMQAREKKLYSAITDCGGGGLSSAVGEMGKDLGVVVDLDKVPLKYRGLSYTEIWISEAQERMIISVPPENKKAILDIFASEDVNATVIGKFTGDKLLTLKYRGKTVANIDMKFLHDGMLQLVRKAVWTEPHISEPEIKQKENYGNDLKKILSSYNIASKEWVIRQYDHEVQGASVIKPLVGAANDGPSDAAVIAPVLGSKKGIVISNGINPKYSDIDPYWMAASAIEEALRNLIAVGGTLNEVALLDNYSWGRTDKPDRLGALVRASEACYYFSKAFGAPFVSGKDSLNNEYQVGDKTICIPHTLLISALGVIDDVTKCITMDIKQKGNTVYIVGTTKNELGGSHYYSIHGFVGRNVPEVDAKSAIKILKKLSNSIQKGLVRSCHDLSEGGFAVAMAEMAFSGEVGVKLDLNRVPFTGNGKRDDVLLFSESNSRFLVEVEPNKTEKFEKILTGVQFAKIGETNDSDKLEISGLSGKTIICEKLNTLKKAWQIPLQW